jgi:hypothetical protein
MSESVNENVPNPHELHQKCAFLQSQNDRLMGLIRSNAVQVIQDLRNTDGDEKVQAPEKVEKKGKVEKVGKKKDKTMKIPFAVHIPDYAPEFRYPLEFSHLTPFNDGQVEFQGIRVLDRTVPEFLRANDTIEHTYYECSIPEIVCANTHLLLVSVFSETVNLVNTHLCLIANREFRYSDMSTFALTNSHTVLSDALRFEKVDDMIRASTSRSVGRVLMFPFLGVVQTAPNTYTIGIRFRDHGWHENAVHLLLTDSERYQCSTPISWKSRSHSAPSTVSSMIRGYKWSKQGSRNEAVLLGKSLVINVLNK